MKNGVVLYGSSFNNIKLEDKENSYMDGSFYGNIEETKYYWGQFIVKENNIKFERWYPSSGGPLRTYVREGTILNDTTFHITESYHLQDGEKQDIDEEDETYHFKSLSPKPDSTNEYTD